MLAYLKQLFDLKRKFTSQWKETVKYNKDDLSI